MTDWNSKKTEKKKIKVAELVTRLEFGGVESVIFNYVSNMSKRECFEFHIITQDINNEECVQQFKDAGFYVHIVTHKRKSIPRNVKELYLLFKREKFDIVHSHMTLMNFYASFIALCCGVKIRISHSHNAFICTNPVKFIFYSLLKWLNLVTATDYMCCGYDAGLFLFGKKNMKKNKVHLINNAIDITKFSFQPQARTFVRNQFGIGKDDFCLGHIGRFMEQKNHRFILEIFDAILKQHSNAKLLLVGAGELLDKILILAEDMGIRNSVFFVGATINPEQFYQAMDVFVLPSLFEGLPVVSVEAQCADLPCLISANVDMHCKITKNVIFISIDRSAEEWAQKALSYKNYPRGIEVINQIRQAGYDINWEAEKLQNFYLERWTSVYGA